MFIYDLLKINTLKEISVTVKIKIKVMVSKIAIKVKLFLLKITHSMIRVSLNNNCEKSIRLMNQNHIVGVKKKNFIIKVIS